MPFIHTPAFGLLLTPAMVVFAQPTPQSVDPWAAANGAFEIQDVNQLRALQGRLAATPTPSTLDGKRIYLLSLVNLALIKRLPARAEAKPLLDSTIKQLDALEPRFPEADSLRAYLYGYKIEYDESLAPVYGPKALSLMDQTVKKAPDNPRVRYFQSLLLLETPAQWGGGPARAEEPMAMAYRSACAESVAQAPWTFTWGKKEALFQLAKIQMQLNRLGAAAQCIQAMEGIDPSAAANLSKQLTQLSSPGK